MTCHLCGVTPDDAELHERFHATLPVTPAGLEHAKAQAERALALLERVNVAGVE